MTAATVIKRRITCLFIAVALIASGCQVADCRFEPDICLAPQPHHFGNLPHAFPPLSQEELATDWGRELHIGLAFAREMDFYRAITAFKRAALLIPPDQIERRLEIDYDIIRAYYIAGKYQDAINEFESSDLRTINPKFPPFADLLLMLYDSYLHVCDQEKADAIFALLQEFAPETANRLQLRDAVTSVDFRTIRERSSDSATDNFISGWCCAKKSVRKAEFLNAVLPGSGYLYVGQKQSALTSFLLNGLFIAASYHFFRHGNWAAGAITASLEYGWYIGGINGAGLEARYHNKALYESLSRSFMCEESLFPVLMFETTF